MLAANVALLEHNARPAGRLCPAYPAGFRQAAKSSASARIMRK